MVRDLVDGLLGRRRPPPVHSDGLLYAVGDVHGRADLLLAVVDRILQDALVKSDPGETLPEVVFVGDVIDRGPDSFEVIEFLMSIRDWPEIRPVFLLGNHELMLLKFLQDPQANRKWLGYGGFETLQSYGLGRVRDLADRDTLRRLAEDLRGAMGPHLAFFENWTPWHRNGNLLITHAGADPELAPEEQTEDALLWGVPEFERRSRRDGLWVVHGHTVVAEPSVRNGRIAIDTGAYITGRLTALKVDGSEISFLTEIGSVPKLSGDAQDAGDAEPPG